MFCSLRCQVREGLGPRLLPSNDKQLYLVWKHTGLSFSVGCGNTEFTAETAKDMWLHMTKPKCLIWSQFSDALTVGQRCTNNTTFLRFLGHTVLKRWTCGVYSCFYKKKHKKNKSSYDWTTVENVKKKPHTQTNLNNFQGQSKSLCFMAQTLIHLCRFRTLWHLPTIFQHALSSPWHKMAT